MKTQPSNMLSLIFGESLHGKTNFLASAIMWGLKQDPELVARLYTVENYDALEYLVEAGALEIWSMPERQDPFHTLNYAAQGYWPVDVSDPASKLRPTGDFSHHWMRFYEGLASYGDYLMGNYVQGGLAARSARGERIGPAEETISFDDNGLKIGGNPRTHYNVVQRFLHGLVVKTGKLPGHTGWTAHETVAQDDRSGRNIVGPELVGTAATSRATRWFGNVLHMVRHDNVDRKEGSVETEYRVYLKPHITPELPNISHRAVIRVPAFAQDKADELIPEYLISDADTYSEIMEIRAQVDQLSVKMIDEIRKSAKGKKRR